MSMAKSSSTVVWKSLGGVLLPFMAFAQPCPDVIVVYSIKLSQYPIIALAHSRKDRLLFT